MQENTASFWGKARQNDDAASAIHPLVAHSLDVAAVAVLLSQARGIGLPGKTIGFLVALHDIGKFSRPFQAMAEQHWPAATLGVWQEARRPPPGPKHDSLGFHLLEKIFADRLGLLLPPRIAGRAGWTQGHRGPVLRALAGHHGRPPLDPGRLGEPVFCAGCHTAAADFIDAMQTLFAPAPLPVPSSDHEIARIAWHLAGLTTLADWIGSRQAWFPYVPPEVVRDPAAYFWDRALPQAAAAIAAAGLATPQPARFTGLRGLFNIAHSSPVQEWAETVELPTGPFLAVIEDLTGSGKTEAALTLAHRVLAAGRASGVFMALPTMATANAMFGRLADAYRGLFVAEAHPSLALAHGRAALDPRFIAAIPVEPSRGPGAADPADESAEAHCAAWLAQDGRRALLAQVGVGTLDQALLAVLPVRHAALRLHGLTGKVLIIDEVHAFDAYMQREMLALLEFHAALGGAVVLLSATLPHAVRQKLVTAFRKGLGVRRPQALTERAYPLATLAGAGTVLEQPCAPRQGLPRRVAVTRLSDADAAVERVVAAVAANAAVAWVRNTVDEAIAATEALRARGLAPLLFHARFAMADRLAIEREVLHRFGREGTNRPGVLVATQVIEQSLDLDFDLLLTDLAPADLLIQRAGRLWRHARPLPRPVPGPELVVISPEPVADPPADWIKTPQPGTAAVYRDPALLWRSARAVFSRGAIVTPDDMRPLIEETFADEVPPALASAAGVAEGKAQAATGVARQNVLTFHDAYDRNAGLWEPEDRTPTRLEDRPTVTLRLAVVRDGQVVPYAEDADPRRAWALSEVSVAQHRIATCPLPPGLEAAATAAKAGWGRWERESERMVLAILVPDDDAAFTLQAATGTGAASPARYHAEYGLHAATKSRAR